MDNWLVFWMGGRGSGRVVIIVGASAPHQRPNQQNPNNPLSQFEKKGEVGDSHEAGYGCKSATTNFQRSQTAFTNTAGDCSTSYVSDYRQAEADYSAIPMRVSAGRREPRTCSKQRLEGVVRLLCASNRNLSYCVKKSHNPQHHAHNPQGQS